jgi:hypothetical protein
MRVDQAFTVGRGNQKRPLYKSKMQTNRTRQKSSIVDETTRRAEIARQLDCSHEDPLKWLDFGILCTCDFFEHEILGRLRQGQHLEIEDVLEIIAAERQNVASQNLHEFVCPVGVKRRSDPQTKRARVHHLD